MGEALVVSSALLFRRGRKHCSKHALCSQMAWDQILTLSPPGCDLGHVTWILPALVSSSINGDNYSVCHMSMRIKWTMYEKHCNSEQPQWTLNMIISIISKHCQLAIYRLPISVDSFRRNISCLLHLTTWRQREWRRVPSRFPSYVALKERTKYSFRRSGLYAA